VTNKANDIYKLMNRQKFQRLGWTLNYVVYRVGDEYVFNIFWSCFY